MAAPNLPPFLPDLHPPRIRLVLLKPGLPFIPCEFEVRGFGPCDAQLCGRRAVASSVELQIPVCRTHVEAL